MGPLAYVPQCRLRLQQPFQRLQLYALASVVRLKATERTPLADSLVVHTVRPPKAHFGSPDDDLAATVLVGRPWFPYGSLMGFLRILVAILSCNLVTRFNVMLGLLATACLAREL